jgi:hypothetical protein
LKIKEVVASLTIIPAMQTHVSWPCNSQNQVGHGKSILQSQHLGGWGKRIASSMPT